MCTLKLCPIQKLFIKTFIHWRSNFSEELPNKTHKTKIDSKGEFVFCVLPGLAFVLFFSSLLKFVKIGRSFRWKKERTKERKKSKLFVVPFKSFAICAMPFSPYPERHPIHTASFHTFGSLEPSGSVELFGKKKIKRTSLANG